MLKTIYIKYGLKSILVIWFFLCILPGDCFVLGCVENDLFHCDQKESVITSKNDADSSIPQSNPHCQNCCMLCAHNLIVYVSKEFSFSFTSPYSWFKAPPFIHFNEILQTLIYHPPRLTA